MTLPQTFLVSVDLDNVEESTGQVFCRMSFHLGLSDIFLTARLGLWVCLEDHKGKALFPSRHYQGYKGTRVHATKVT